MADVFTIDDLNALAALTAADEVPVWDAEASGEPTKKITAQNMANSVKSLASLPNTTEMNTAIDQSTADVIRTGDVVNNLTSTETDKPLSAAQGKALNDLIAQSTADTGWIALNNTYPTRYRVRAGVCYINMRLAGGATPTDGTLLGTLPAEYRPAFEFAAPTQNLRGSVSIRIDGTVYINANTNISGGLNNYMAAVLTYPIG